MASKGNGARETGWFGLDEASEAFGMTRQGFHVTVRPLLPDSAVKGAGERGVKVHLPTAISLYTSAQVEKAKPVIQPAADPMMAGIDSPALERYRIARAKMAERDLDEREQKLVRLDDLREALRRGISALRDTGERLIRAFGNEAGEIFNEGVGEFEAAAVGAMQEKQQPSPMDTERE